jgi:8-oxo-dGTP pyrophosphatase MutT (NUDIX family)
MDEQSFYASLPRKRAGATALFFDHEGHILLVNPTYVDHWLFPGGGIEAEESPAQGCAREVQEELGLTIQLGRLLCIDYLPSDGHKTEAFQFMFDCGILNPQQIEKIVLQESELCEYRFVTATEALNLLSPRTGRRLTHCLQAYEQNTTLYLEDGQIPFVERKF